MQCDPEMACMRKKLLRQSVIRSDATDRLHVKLPNDEKNITAICDASPERHHEILISGDPYLSKHRESSPYGKPASPGCTLTPPPQTPMLVAVGGGLRASPVCVPSTARFGRGRVMLHAFFTLKKKIGFVPFRLSLLDRIQVAYGPKNRNWITFACSVNRA